MSEVESQARDSGLGVELRPPVIPELKAPLPRVSRQVETQGFPDQSPPSKKLIPPAGMRELPEALDLLLMEPANRLVEFRDVRIPGEKSNP
jgi:hypothetical protein